MVSAEKDNKGIEFRKIKSQGDVIVDEADYDWKTGRPVDRLW